MHYYQHNINDYLASTTHLSLLEHGVYIRLIQYYYTNECGFSEEDLTVVKRRLSIRSDEEQQALENVLTDFFELVDGVYTLERCDKEIKAYHGKIEQASKAGKKSAEARSKKAKGKQSKAKKSTDVQQNSNDSDVDVEQGFSGSSTGVQLTNNHKPITNNHKPNKNTLDAWFDNFWEVYPRKEGKKPARASFHKAVSSESDYNIIMEGLRNQREYLNNEHTRAEKSYCQHASTWINQARWEDEIRKQSGVNNANGTAGNKSNKATGHFAAVRGEFDAKYGEQSSGMRTVN